MSGSIVAHGQGPGLGLADQDHEAFPAGDAGVNQVPLQQQEVLHRQRDDHRGELRALGLVDGDGVGQRDFVQFPKIVNDLALVELHPHLPLEGVDAQHVAQIPIKHLLVVVVLSLHDFVAHPELPAELLDRRPRPVAGD